MKGKSQPCLKKKIGILGSGSWATALAKMLCENNTQINWFIRKPTTKSFFLKHHHNKNYLSSVNFDLQQLKLYSDPDQIVKDSDILIIAIPSAFLSDTLNKISTSFSNKIIFNAVKGIIPENQKLVGEHFHDVLGLKLDQIGVITGPCHAEEVALERLSYLTIACSNNDNAQFMAESLSCDYIKCKISN